MGLVAKEITAFCVDDVKNDVGMAVLSLTREVVTFFPISIPTIVTIFHLLVNHSDLVLKVVST